MKKILLLLLTFALICGTLVSCNKNTESSNSESEATTTTQDDQASSDTGFEYLAPKGMGGYNWRLLMIDGEAQALLRTEEDASKSKVDEAHYKRDSWMVSRYNIGILTINSGSMQVGQYVLTNSLGGDDLFDIGVLHTSENLVGVVNAGLCYDIKSLPHVDLDQPYYNQQANTEYTLFGKQYLMTGDYPCVGGGSPLFLFNKTMMDAMELEYPYELVLNGDWTLERMKEYCANAYLDMDNIPGKSIGDRYGLAGAGGATFDYQFLAIGGTILTRDENGAAIPSLTGDHNEQRYAKLYEMAEMEWCYAEKDNATPEALNGTIQWFEGRTLFHNFSRYMTDLTTISEFDYGVAVLPKYDEDQSDYIIPAAGGITFIPSTIKDADTVGYLLEAFGQITHTTLRPAIIDDYRDHRIIRSDIDLQVYEMSMKHFVYRFSDYIDPSNALRFCSLIGAAIDADRASFSAYVGDVESSIKAYFNEFYYGD